MEPTAPNIKINSSTPEGAGTGTNSKKTSSQYPIRTMKSDMDEAIKKQHETAVSIALAEEKKKEKARVEALKAKQAQTEDITPAPKRRGRVVIVFAFILLISLVVLAYLFVLPKLGAIKIPTVSLPVFEKAAEIITPPVISIVEPLAPSMIPAQSEKRFDISSETTTQVVAKIATEKGKGTYAGSIKNLYFTGTGIATSTTEISANRFLSFMNAQAPSILSRTLEEQFMVGFFGEANGGATPFIILNVSDHNTGLAGMLEWESSLPEFFNTLFTIKVTATKPSIRKFTSVLVNEKDARMLEINSVIKIIYVFANQNSIIISGSQSAAEELLLLVGKK